MPKKRNKIRISETKEDDPIVDEVSAGNENEVLERKKYGRRQIQSNWDRYRPESPKLDEDGADKAEDFAALLNAPADCNYFRFKSEKDWEREAVSSSFGGHKLFNLDLELLSNGLACIPFYERVALDKTILSETDIESCDRKAEQSASHYKIIVDRFLKKLESENELPCTDEKAKDDVKIKKVEKQTEPDDSLTSMTEKNENSAQFMIKNYGPKVPPQKSVKHANAEDEDLEDWLDSVLDD